jgi:hypothetical protein
MKRIAKAVGVLLLLLQGHSMASSLDYDQLVLLDAENLAETGLKEAYESLLPKLKRYVLKPANIEERINYDAPRYSVVADNTEYVIYDPTTDESEAKSWGRATWALFSIINKQLSTSGVAFYAINGGNDLGGMFLTSKQAEAARLSLPRRTDWPYLPTDQHPWYGQQH